jgi:salicylate hydroxylase
VSRKAHILIAGGGIAGLTAALALLQRDYDVDVYEQAPELREIGAGVQIAPNGSRVLLDLELGERLAAVVCEAAAKEVRLWNTGQTWKLFDLGRDCIERFGAPYWTVHRGDFHKVLYDAVRALKADAVHLDHAVNGFRQDGSSATLTFANGKPDATGNAVIGSDGVHSQLRSAAGIADKPFFTGIMAWRGIAPAEKLPDDVRRPVGANWVGPGGHVITYPLRRGEIYNFVGIIEGRDWAVESWTERGTTEECLADFANWHPSVQQIIRSLDVPFKWALLGREPLLTWAFGRVCLMGDACHPTLPFLAQGANMAIEDGLVLARCIDARPDDVPGALKRYERLRAERCAKIVRGSSDNARRFHNPVLADPQRAADYVTREWEPERVRTRYDWLFEYDARTVDVS